MSDPQLLEGESFFVDPMELIEAKKEIRRLNTLLDNKEAIHQKAMDALNHEIESLKEAGKHSPVIKLKEPIGFSVRLLNIISFLLLWKEVVFFKKKDFGDRPEVDARKLVNVIKAIDTFFAPYLESIDSTGSIEDRLFELVDYLQEEVFVFAGGDNQKLGATPNFTDSPIHNLANNSKKFYEDTWKDRRENKKKKKKRSGAAAKKIA